jgi:hypothetical protein
MSSWCPLAEFNELVRKQDECDPIGGSTVWESGQPPRSVWDQLKNIFYTDYLRMRALMHRGCEKCKRA